MASIQVSFPKQNYVRYETIFCYQTINVMLSGILTILYTIGRITACGQEGWNGLQISEASYFTGQVHH